MSQPHSYLLAKQPSFPQRTFLKLMGSTIPTGGDIAPGITRLADSYSTSYVVSIGGGKSILVDAGTDKSAKEIIGYLTSQEVAPSDVVAVFLTHAHPDHFAGISQFPDAIVYVAAEDKGVLEGAQKFDGMLPGMAGKLKKPVVKDLALIKIIADGQSIAIGDKSIRAFAVPGHTKGSFAYLIDDVLFVGDALTFGRKKAMGPPPALSFDSKLGIESLRTLLQQFDNEGIVPRLIVPAHSGEGTLDHVRKLVA